MFLDYEGKSFDHYLQQRTSSLARQTHSLSSSFDFRGRSLSEAAVQPVGIHTSLSSRALPDLPREDVLHHYESLEVRGVRHILYPMEREISHNEEEAAELVPEYYNCVMEQAQGQTGSGEAKSPDGEDFYRPWSLSSRTEEEYDTPVKGSGWTSCSTVTSTVTAEAERSDRCGRAGRSYDNSTQAAPHHRAKRPLPLGAYLTRDILFFFCLRLHLYIVLTLFGMSQNSE